MLAELRDDNKDLVAHLRALHDVCDEHNDVATTSLIEVWIDETERRLWFLFEIEPQRRSGHRPLESAGAGRITVEQPLPARCQQRPSVRLTSSGGGLGICPCMPSRRSSTRCRARARTRARPPCSAALPAAICGPAASRTAPTATCQFCDTDFVGTDGTGGGKFRDSQGSGRLPWTRLDRRSDNRFVVLTGGEPALQVDAALIDALHGAGFRIAIETNGTLPVAARHRLDLRQSQSRDHRRADERATN